MLSNPATRKMGARPVHSLVKAELDSLKLCELAAEVGGDDVLEGLDDSPLPDEPFDWTGIAEDIAPRVREVLALVDRCCDDLLDVEYRTACRRLLARAAVGDPKVFRREAKTDTAAAASVWIVGKANKIFDGSERLLLASRVVHYLGVKGSASSRAETLARAASFECDYLDVRLDATFLVSRHRRTIVEERERYRYTDLRGGVARHRRGGQRPRRAAAADRDLPRLERRGEVGAAAPETNSGRHARW